MEKRFYSKKELAEITGYRIEDVNHFKRNVESALSKWGYRSDWVRGFGAIITKIPETPEERLKEILIRQFHVDIQVDMYAFACFVTAFTDIEGFACMPWAERETEYFNYSGIYVEQATLSNWSKNLFEQGIMMKGEAGSFWRTDVLQDGSKVRTQVTAEEAQSFFKRRSMLIEHNRLFLSCVVNMTPKEKEQAAWSDAYRVLWKEYKCCYYSCKTFSFAAFTEQGLLAEVYELTREISGKEENRG